MTDLRKAAEMALEALNIQTPLNKREFELRNSAIEALRQALAQPPCQTGPQCLGGKCPECVPTYEFECPRCGHCCQQKEWVGLTHEERDEIDQNCRSQMEALFAIEAKLKEKNT